MKTKIDIEKWNRQEQYLFFREYDIPFFNITSKLNCTGAVEFAQKNNLSLFVCYMYASLRAVNETEEFRYRIIKEEVYSFDVVHAGTTVLKENKSFAFAYFDYLEDFNTFYTQAKEKIEKAKTMKKLEASENNDGVIHYSTLPWINFDGVMHPRKLGQMDSIPKITFGKIHDVEDKKMISCNVEANHALMDGYHVALYFKRMEEVMDSLSNRQ